MQPAAQSLPRRLLAGLIALGLGAAAALGQAPWGFWPLSMLALVILVWRVGQARHPQIEAFAAGFGYFAVGMFWITEPFLVEPEIYGWMAPFALVLFAAGGGLFWAIPAWVSDRLTSGARNRAIGFAAALVLSDWLRGWIFTGFPWALLGHIWIDTPAGQFAAIGGGIGLSGLTMIAAALPVALAHKRSLSVAGSLIAVLTIALAWVWGLNRMITPLPTDRPQILRLVQPNAQQALKWDAYWADVFFQRLIDLSAAPSADGRRPDAVIWPETAVNFLLEQAGDLPRQIAEVAGAPILLGIQRSEDGRYYNSFAEFNSQGVGPQVYDKFHLVPFGEYTPWGDTLAKVGISAFAAQQGNGYSKGHGPEVLSGLASRLPPAQVLICYEAIFPQHLLLNGTPRPEWLLQVTNDAWFGTASGPWQHLAQARLRAIESGLPMIRVANTGISAVIDARGNLRAELALNTEGFVDAALPGALPATLWSKTGNLPAVLIAFFVFCIAALRRKAR